MIGSDGPLKEQLQQQIEELGLKDRVTLLGGLKEEKKQAYFGACDVFCLSSVMKTEAYAIVLVEAMSLGRPVIAAKIPESGVSWVNAHEVSGLNVPVRDPEALAEAIHKICGDPELWKRYSQGARQRYDDIFTKDEMINNLIETYTQLLNNN